MDDVSFNLCTLPLVFLLGITETSLAAFFIPSFQVFISTDKTLSEPSCVQKALGFCLSLSVSGPQLHLGQKGAQDGYQQCVGVSS